MIGFGLETEVGQQLLQALVLGQQVSSTTLLQFQLLLQLRDLDGVKTRRSKVM